MVLGATKMNKSQAVRWKGQAFRLRPIAIQRTELDERLPQHDDKWTVADVSDIAATVSNVRTGHEWSLGLDNVREFRTPDFLLLRCQLILKGPEVHSEPLMVTTVDRNITGFESLLRHSWVREIIANREVWISEVDNLFQIEVGGQAGAFSEEWTRRFPDANGSFAYSVLLKVQGVEIKQLLFISCDGGRIFVPRPAATPAVNRQLAFSYERSSLEYKVGQIAGQFHIYNTLEGVAQAARITVR
jgi:hypothetical protein